jgi:hypothetical protein
MPRSSITAEQAIANQLAYIAGERRRMTLLQDAFRAYTRAARKLGSRALTPDEINERFRELNRMEVEAESAEYAERAEQIAKWQAEADA